MQSARSSRPGLGRSLAAAGLIAVILPALALAGCEASIGAETQDPYTPGQGVHADTDELRLRGVVAVSAVDGSATLVGTILNQSSVDDALETVRFRGGRTTLGRSPLPLRGRGIRVLGVDTSQGKATPATLSGRAVRAGVVVPLTFDFRRAGTVTLNVLVVSREGPFATVPAPSKPATP
ncbi:hypothetical protein ABN028_24840 [Actinopolymorpha sp. B17G11]|uniref:hypothetical protein n=1 Tax=unclassified Actinopolymorpha TaxID=2627063 RepID=UPI0032D92B06